MSQRLPVFRAARLVGVSRNKLQKEIQEQGIETFEGMINVSDLLNIHPEIDLSHDTEFERVENIKATAFAKRVRERVLPDAEILASRLTEVGQTLADTRTQVTTLQSLLNQITNRLIKIDNMANGKGDHALANKEIHTLLGDIRISLDELDSHPDPAQEILAYDKVLSIMSAHVKIQPSNHEFWLEGNSTLLDAGIRSGLSLNYGCTNGNCGLCKARVVSGETKKIQNHDYVLSESEKNMNYILMCSCTAVSDVVIEALEARDENDIPRQEIPTKVKRVNKLNNNTIELHTQTPRIQRLRFLAGQSVTLSFPDGNSKDFPIASCPCDDRNLLFHIRPFDSINNLLKGDVVTVNGPHGHFLLNEESKRSQVYIAFGIGFAPVKSLIEHAMALDNSTSLHLYWVVNNEDELYLHNLCRSWEDALEYFHYHPIVNSEPLTQILDNYSHDNPDHYDFYLAGTETETSNVKNKLLDNGFTGEQITTNIIKE